MSLPPWLELRPEGLYCLPGDFFLDPGGKVAKAVVTHAHADHYRRGLNEVWCTPDTAALAKVRYHTSAGKKVHRTPFEEEFNIGEVQLRFLPAGHMLGSAQVLLQYQGKNVLFSGDFNLFSNSTCIPLAFPNVDIDLLICESTFGEKEQHPDPVQQLKEVMTASTGRNLMIGTYVLGKAQHLHSLLQEHYPNLTVFLHPEILKFHRVYADAGKMTAPITPWRRQTAKRMADQFAYLIPPRMLSSFKGDYSWFKLFASGWDRRKTLFYLDHHLEISDHASGNEILEYIRKIGPKEVAFHHGYPDPLIQACKLLKIQSYTLHLQPEN